MRPNTADGNGQSVKVELFYFDGCPSYAKLVPRLAALLADAGVSDALTLRRVESDAAAQRERFLGSPTVRINGKDVDGGARERTDFGLKCRLYKTADGLHGTPPDEWIAAALARAKDEVARSARQ